METDYFASPLTEEEVRAMGSLALAHVGDAVFELLVRVHLAAAGGRNGSLHRAAVEMVNAAAQAGDMEKLLPLLTEEDPAGRFRILGVETEHPGFPKNTAPLDSLESWEYGTIEEGVFRPLRSFRRSWKYPELVNSLKQNPAEITAVMTTDAAGIRRLYRRKA